MGRPSPINFPRVAPVNADECTVMTRVKPLSVPRMAEFFDEDEVCKSSDSEDAEAGDLGLCMTNQYRRRGAHTRSMGGIIRDGDTFYDSTP
jgi:hypothetical protein